MGLINIFLFLVAFLALWKSAELTVKGIEKISKSTRISSFATSFLILGILTSLTEISVGINAVLDKKPEVFVGNLVGGSFVILMLIIPALAIFNKGIVLKNHLNPQKLFFFLVLIVSPSFVILDGTVTRTKAIFILLLYALFFYLFQKGERLQNIDISRLENKTVYKNFGKIAAGAILIFISSKILVDQTIILADVVGIPSFFISLLLLSVGTNLPELVIAVNSIKRKTSDIAFGDYVGSAAANPLLFGILTLFYGPFTLQTKGFDFSFWIIVIAYGCFFVFARTKNRITPREGMLLLLFYLVFLLTQTTEALLLSPHV